MERASVREKICYGIGSMSYCMELTIMLSYLLLFCSDVMLLDVTVIGLVMTGTKVLDAVTDIVITNIADRTNSRLGKYRIWILMGLPLALFLFLTFSCPAFLGTQNQKVFWICLMYILTVPVFETAVTSPFIVLNTTMSSRRQDRMDFSLARALGESGANIIISAACMTIILHFGSYRDPAGWRVMAGIMAACIAVCTVIGFFGTKERVRVSNADAHGNRLKLRDKLRLLKGNRPFAKLMVIIVAFMFYFYSSMSLFSYFCINNLGHAEWISPLQSIGMAVQIATVVLLIVLSRKTETRALLISGGVSIVLGVCFLMCANGFAAAAVYEVLAGIGNGIFNSVAFAALADVSDYTQWKTGIAIPGMISASATFAMKLGGALSSFLATKILVWAQYDSTLEIQSAQTCAGLRTGLVLCGLISMTITTVCACSFTETSSGKLRMYREAISQMPGA